MPTLLVFAGLGQLGLVLASLLLPRILNWREEVARLGPLTRRIFWVYAGYILGTNLCLGTLSAFWPHLLLDRSVLARVIAGYACGYWGVRLLIQMLWFRQVVPRGRGYAVADLAVTLLFVLWTGCYGAILIDAW